MLSLRKMKGVSTMMMYASFVPLLSLLLGLVPIALQVVMCVLLYKIWQKMK